MDAVSRRGDLDALATWALMDHSGGPPRAVLAWQWPRASRALGGIATEVSRALAARLARLGVGTLAPWGSDDPPTGPGIRLQVDLARPSRGLLSATALVHDSGNDLPLHIDRIEGRSGDDAVRASLTDRLQAALCIYTRAQDRLRMQQRGARHPRAFLLFEDAERHRNDEGLAHLNHLAGQLREAIDLDPTFADAYLLLDSVYYSLALSAPSALRRDEYRRLARALATEARGGGVAPAVVEALDIRYQSLALTHPQDAERYWRQKVLEQPDAEEPLRTYGYLLNGAGWDLASERIIDHLIARSDGATANAIASDRASVLELRGQHAAQVDAMKWNLEVAPNFTLSTYGLVEALGFLGRFHEADAYLERLRAADSEGAWAHAAYLSLATFRGSITPGSKDWEEALAHPLTTNVIRGRVCFIAGDVASGVAAWRRIEPGLTHLIWHFIGQSENYFAPHVVTDPRYMQMLEEFGLGVEWLQQLATGYAEVAAALGLEQMPAGAQPCRREPQRFAAARWMPKARRTELRERSALTPAEHRLLKALQRGLTLAEYAAETGRSINTVRNQVKQLLHKTGSRRQADLLRRHPGHGG